jgi:hypothetical protein
VVRCNADMAMMLCFNETNPIWLKKAEFLFAVVYLLLMSRFQHQRELGGQYFMFWLVAEYESLCSRVGCYIPSSLHMTIFL